MSALVRAEIRKLQWTRSLWLLPVIGVVLSVVAAGVAIVVLRPNEIAQRLSEHGPLRFGATNVGLVLALLGIRLFGDEVQHHTLASTFIRVPSRLRVLVVKAGLAAVVALLVTTVIYALTIVPTVVVADRRNLSMAVDGAATAWLFVRTSAAMLVLALIGVAFAAATRNRTVALLAYLLWITLGETIAGGLTKAPEYMPGALVRAVVSDTGTPGAAAAFALLLGLTALLFGFAIVSLRRDVD